VDCVAALLFGESIAAKIEFWGELNFRAGSISVKLPVTEIVIRELVSESSSSGEQ
jgi:hypothetical protein